MADCYLYNLKGVKYDPEEAHRLYALAAELFQPEAMSYHAGCKYMNVVKPFYYLPQPLAHDYPRIPPDKKLSLNMEEYEGVWYWLERVAIMDLRTPFLVSQAQQAKQLDIWPLSNTVKDLMKRRASGALLNFKYMHLMACSNELCTIHVDTIHFFQPCLRCFKEKYCNTKCKEMLDNIKLYTKT